MAALARQSSRASSRLGTLSYIFNTSGLTSGEFPALAPGFQNAASRPACTGSIYQISGRTYVSSYLESGVGRFRGSRDPLCLEVGGRGYGGGASCGALSGTATRVPPVAPFSLYSSLLATRVWSAMAHLEESVIPAGEDEAVSKIENGDNGQEEEDRLQTSESEEGESPSIFTRVQNLVDVTVDDIGKYLTLSEEDQSKYFGEGLPGGLVKEFEVTKQSSLLIRPRVLQLCDQLHRCVMNTSAFNIPVEEMTAAKPRKHYLLDGPAGSGKSVALAMLVYWARSKGWLVFYIPSGKDWTHGSFYYRNEEKDLWDTPTTAQTALEGFLKSHSRLLDTLPCRILDPIPLGEGAGVGRARGPQQITLPGGATLKHLVEKGLSMSHAGVGAVVRLRQELSLVTEVPVLVAIDDYNSWFVFSEYGRRVRRPIHAQKLTMVNAFGSMEGSDVMMVAAFSQSIAIGKLPVQLPGVPKGVRFDFPRYSPFEANTALQYYHRCEVPSKEPEEEDVIRLYYLTNGNGVELRKLARFL